MRDEWDERMWMTIGGRRIHVDQITEAVERAGREARLRHKQAGVPLVVWRDGKVV